VARAEERIASPQRAAALLQQLPGGLLPHQLRESSPARCCRAHRARRIAAAEEDPSPRAGDLGIQDRSPAHSPCSPVHDAPAIVSGRWALAAKLGGASVGPGRWRRAGGVAQRNRGRRRCRRNVARKETHGRR
jgi:hypothetical protein